MSPSTKRQHLNGQKTSSRKVKGAISPSTWHGEKSPTSPSGKMREKRSKKDDLGTISHHSGHHESPKHHKKRESSSSQHSPSKSPSSKRSPRSKSSPSNDTTTPRKRNTTKGSPNLAPSFSASSPSSSHGSPNSARRQSAKSRSGSRSSSSGKKTPGQSKLKSDVQQQLRNGMDKPLPFHETDPNTASNFVRRRDCPYAAGSR